MSKIVIKIKNFRSYTVNQSPESDSGFFTYTFERGVNLLKGSSGVGKSTVFMAISWCLFKKPAIGNTPLFNKEDGSQNVDKDTVVILSIDDGQVVIKRTKSLLTVTLNEGETLENEEAQAYINKNYGKEHVWKTCNYVSQGSINHLISGELTDAQRWEVLYTIAFETNQGKEGSISMDTLKAALRLRSEETNRQVQSSQILIDKILKRVNDLKNSIDSKTETLGEIREASHPLMSLSEGEISEILYEMSKISEVKIDQDAVSGSRVVIQELRDTIAKNKLNVDSLQNSIDKLNREKDAEEETFQLIDGQMKKAMEECQAKINSSNIGHLQNFRKTMTRVFDSIDGLKAMIDKMEFGERGEIMGRLSRTFSRIFWIKQRKEDADFILNTNPETLNRMIAVKEQIERETLARKHLEDLETLILKSVSIPYHLKAGKWLDVIDYEPEKPRTIVSCPCCNEQVSVFLNGAKIDKIVKYNPSTKLLSRELLDKIRQRDLKFEEVSKFDQEDKSNSGVCSKTLSELRMLKQDIAEWNLIPVGLRKMCLRLLPVFNLDTKTFTEFRDLGNDYMEISDIDGIEKQLKLMEENLKTLRVKKEENDKKLREIQTKYRDLIREKETEFRRLLLSNRDLESSLTKKETELKKMEKEERWWKRLESLEIHGGKEELKTLTSLRSRILELRKEIDNLQLQCQSEETRVREEQTAIKDKLDRLRLLSELQSDVETVESNVLQECVERVSSLSNQFLENAFDVPILVNLVTEKESKTSKTKKHSVGISIKSGKSGAGTSLIDRPLDGFSGGETDRISLGFSNAITTFSPFPMLLLDECISSLDTEMKDRVIRALRQQAKLTNKAVVLVCHDAVDGLFDHVCLVE